jgi:hypothetical protein
MAANALSLSERRELASRTSDDLEVTLWWDPRIDAVAVSVWDWKRDRALDVFYHPFSYGSRHGLDDAMAGAL